MATISSNKDVTLPDGTVWVVSTDLDTTTGQKTTYVTSNSGSQVVTPRSSNEAIAFISRVLGTAQPQTANLLIAAINEQVASLDSQAEAEKATEPASGEGVDQNEVNDDTGTTSASEDTNTTTDSGTTVAAKAGNSEINSDTQTANNSMGVGTGVPGKRLYNPLSELSSYTYQLSLYMATPDAINLFHESGKRNVNFNPGELIGGGGYYLIAQSGGVNESTSDRAPGFELDLYIDDLVFEKAISAKETSAPAGITDFTFKLYEPHGISFYARLNQAVVALKKDSMIPGYKEFKNVLDNPYVLGIRFFGYDKNGSIVTRSSYSDADQNAASDENALFERFYDIKFEHLKFKMDGKMTVYNIKAVQQDNREAFGIKRGRINNRAPVRAATVQQAIEGDPNDSSVTGLFQILNDEQQAQLAKGEIEIKNEYKVKFLPENNTIASARIVSIADTDKSRMPMSTAKNSSESNTATAATATPDKSKREISFETDMSILQAFTKIISQSSYVESALRFLITTEVDPEDPEDEEKQRKNPKKLKWFNVTTKLKCLGFDTSRNDFAYEITYIVHEYEIPYVRSDYVKNTTKYYGAHKLYDYWLTGKNSEVLSFEADFDTTYFQVSLDPVKNSQTITPKVTNRRQNADSTGRLNEGSEAQNAIIADMMDPSAFQKATMRILGDPDYLIQSDVGALAELSERFYGKDGYTINPNGGQVFIEVNFKDSYDYSNTTGTMIVNNQVMFTPQSMAGKINSSALKLLVTSVISTYSKGKFEQQLALTMPEIGQLNQGTTKSTDQRPGNSAATTSGDTRDLPNNEFDGVDDAVFKESGYQQDDVTGLDEAIARNAEDDNIRQAAADADLFYTGSTVTSATDDGFQVADDDAQDDRDAMDQEIIAQMAAEGGRED